MSPYGPNLFEMMLVACRQLREWGM